MATIPLAITAISELWPILKPAAVSIVQHVEQLFGAKTGQTKFDVAVKALTQIADALATAGKLPGIPDLGAIGGLIESVVQDLKGLGQLDSPSPAKPITPTPV